MLKLRNAKEKLEAVAYLALSCVATFLTGSAMLPSIRANQVSAQESCKTSPCHGYDSDCNQEAGFCHRCACDACTVCNIS